MKVLTIDGFIVQIGENSKENDNLITNSKSTDMWFHLSSFPSPHVIVSPGDLSIYITLKAASLCREYSKYKNLKNIYVDYTRISNLRKTENLGQVEYKSNRIVKKINI